MGSGKALAEPFVAFVNRVLWKDEPPNVEAAVFGVYWALSHTLKIAPGGVGEPIQIATLRADGGAWQARLLPDTVLQEQRVAEIEEQINQFKVGGEEEVRVEDPPTPPRD